MATFRLLQLGLCLGAPVGVLALFVKQDRPEPRQLVASGGKTSATHEVEWCASDPNSPSEAGEIFVAREKEQSCMPPSTAGVGSISFVKRSRPEHKGALHRTGPHHHKDADHGKPKRASVHSKVAHGHEQKLSKNHAKADAHKLSKNHGKAELSKNHAAQKLSKNHANAHAQALSKKQAVRVSKNHAKSDTRRLRKNHAKVEEESESMPDWGDGHHGELSRYGGIGDECIQQCHGTPGYCEWCGAGGACCRKDASSDPAECNRASFLKNAGTHECVLSPIFDEIDTEYIKSSQQLVVWVSGYPRSGSSTLLSMVSATVDDNRAGGHTFSLFEPCHDDDEYEPWLTNKGCRQLLYDVSHCDFRGIQKLWGWRDPHSTSNSTKNFAGALAMEMCEEADIVAFKTVDWGHDLQEWNWLLNSRENMKVLDMVRDPRAIYSSWKKLEPFKTLVDTHDFYTLIEICNHFAKNIDFGDKRVKRVIFEDLMRDPETTTREVYKFLEEPYTDVQQEWVRGTFDAQDCPPPPPGMEGFTDCHTASGVDPRGDEHWRDILTAEELAIFEHSESCQRVAAAYRYPPK